MYCAISCLEIIKMTEIFDYFENLWHSLYCINITYISVYDFQCCVIITNYFKKIEHYCFQNDVISNVLTRFHVFAQFDQVFHTNSRQRYEDIENNVYPMDRKAGICFETDRVQVCLILSTRDSITRHSFWLAKELNSNLDITMIIYQI